jgi:two-component system sensor histidine kinase QseC
LGYLIGGVDRLTRVVNQLLTLARVEPRLGQRATIEVDLGEVVTDILAELTPWILDRGLEPSLEIGAGDLRLAIDAGALGIALQNLVSNAVEHSPPGGRITVSLKRLGSRFELTVEDEGSGIDKASLTRVFERFYSRNSPNGAGLGLSIVATIIERMGGQVRLDNRADGGLAATLSLPLL